MKFFTFLLFAICGWCADFDCVFVGSSPFSLFEAIYQSQIGKKVLVVEAADDFGGAWRTIEVCGIPEVDLGCHEIGSDETLASFLTDCVGCHLVSLDRPFLHFGCEEDPSGFYFSKGCSELMGCLKKLIAKTDITIFLDTKVDRVALQDTQAIVETERGSFSAEKIFVTERSAFEIQDGPHLFPLSAFQQQFFYHVYLLIEDPSFPRFSYTSCNSPQIYRAMNLSYFARLEGTGRHLIIVQTPKERANGEALLEELKQKQLIDPDARLLQEETCTYARFSQMEVVLEQLSLAGRQYFHFLDTNRFIFLGESAKRWREVLGP